VSPVGLVLIVIAFAFVWLALLRPQKRRQLEQARVWEGLEAGDEVLTAGGVYGSITGFDGDAVLLEIAPGIEVRVARRAIAAVVPPDDEEEAEEAGDGRGRADPGSYSGGAS
jgi:preprotein translocase subunit YajC